MTAMNAPAEGVTRVVRPWIAALLTFFLGWGLGFYYARLSKAAFWWAVAQVVLGVVLGIAAAAFLVFVAPNLLAPNGEAPIFVGWAISLPVAVAAWIAAAKTPRVARG